MKEYNRIIFVGQSGTSREPMAAGIFQDFTTRRPFEVLARGLVVLFPEPMNQKAEAVLISNGIHTEDFISVQLMEEDLTEDTLVLAMEEAQKEKMEDFLRREFGAKEVILTLREDKSLIGGFILSAGDKEFDWSLRGRYNNLRQKLTRR